uniref:Uncharacterized protein n=1 Tax=Nothobranchius furzeri TaxID=105023 RepID=A0A1A8A0J2_NOTFU
MGSFSLVPPRLTQTRKVLLHRSITHTVMGLCSRPALGFDSRRAAKIPPSDGESALWQLVAFLFPSADVLYTCQSVKAAEYRSFWLLQLERTVDEDKRWDGGTSSTKRAVCVREGG